VLVLPETGTDGALEVAERIRARVEAVRILRIGCDPGHREPGGRDDAGLGAGCEGSDRGRRRGAVPSHGSGQDPI
jgi:hypothetical protein